MNTVALYGIPPAILALFFFARAAKDLAWLARFAWRLGTILVALSVLYWIWIREPWPFDMAVRTLKLYAVPWLRDSAWPWFATEVWPIVVSWADWLWGQLQQIWMEISRQ